MKYTWLKCIIALMMLSAAMAAKAQYVWLDEKGVKQFSDMPPPAGVPKSRILKQPVDSDNFSVPSPNTSANAQNASTSNASQPPAVKPPPTLAEKNIEFEKRRAEQAEKEKKDAEKARQEAEKQKNCQRAQENARTLNSGMRITGVDSNGQRYYLNDQQRAQELRDANQTLADCQ
jgi:hypothetical protein